MTTRSTLAVTALASLLAARSFAQDAALMELVGKCKADVAERAEVAVEDVAVSRVEEVVWRDGSLGCPQPGMEYTMALVPGYRMMLQAKGTKYQYNTDKVRRFVYCEGDGVEPYQVVREVAVPAPGAPLAGGALVLYLQPLDQEPNLNSLLIATDFAGPEFAVVEHCTDFVVSADGWVLAKERTSRSGHCLWLTRLRGDPEVVMQAFDFRALTLSRSGDAYAFLTAPRVGERFRVHVGRPGQAPQALDWAPTVRAGSAVQLARAGNLVVLTECEPEGTPKVYVLDLDSEKVLATLDAAHAEPVELPAAD